MNKRRLLFVECVLGFGLTFFIGSSSATPPRSVELQYDAKNGKLFIDIAHISDDQNRHYIQKIEVFQNAQAPIVIEHYRQQVNPTNFYVTMPMKAEIGDIIKVVAHCREGGSVEGMLEIAEDLLEKEAVPFPTPARAVPTLPSDPQKSRPAVTVDPRVAKPTLPKDPAKVKPAVTRDPSVAKPAVPKDPSISKPAVPEDSKPAAPKYSSSLKPATPDYHSRLNYE